MQIGASAPSHACPRQSVAAQIPASHDSNANTPSQRGGASPGHAVPTAEHRQASSSHPSVFGCEGSAAQSSAHAIGVQPASSQATSVAASMHANGGGASSLVDAGSQSHAAGSTSFRQPRATYGAQISSHAKRVHAPRLHHTRSSSAQTTSRPAQRSPRTGGASCSASWQPVQASAATRTRAILPTLGTRTRPAYESHGWSVEVVGCC